MNRFLGFLLLIAVCVVGLGFYLGWFRIGSDNADGKSNVKLSVDVKKIEEDKDKAVAGVQDVARQIKDKVSGTSEKTMEGTFVSATADKVTFTDKDGKEMSEALAAKAPVTCDGKACQAADLKAGMKIRVTSDSANAATRIDALDKEKTFAGTSHDGKAVSITPTTLVMTNMEGADEKSYTLTADTKITCDGKDCPTTDLKAGMKIRVTTSSPESHAATRIEALNKNQAFEKSS